MQTFALHIRRLPGTLLVATLMATSALATPHRLVAQDTTAVYDQEDVTTPPQLTSKRKASEILRRVYPEKLQQVGIEGSAQIAVIVGTDGKVESGSSEIVSATVAAFGTAGKDAVEKFEFKPGLLKGTPVRVRVLVPLAFKVR